jgi:hypothetical protein
MESIAIAMVLSGPFYILVFELLRWLKRDKPERTPIVTQLGDQFAEIRPLISAVTEAIQTRNEVYAHSSGLGAKSPKALLANMPESVAKWIDRESEDWAREGLIRLAMELYEELDYVGNDNERWAEVLKYLKLQEGE